MIASVYDQASNFVGEVDKAFYFILGISFFFLIAITATMIIFVIKYNRKKGKPAVQIKDNAIVETIWIVVPLLLVTLMFFYGYWAFVPMRNPPDDAIQIKVTARMWQWSFEYEGNRHCDSLVVPINKAVKLDLYSPDVIHGFYIPAFRLKEDVVPGKNNFTWFIAQKEGNYELLCSAYCGVRHSYMGAVVKVVSEQEFNDWLNALPVLKIDSANAGLILLQNNGCMGCHSIDETKLVGPSFKGLYGSTIDVEKEGGETQIVVDEAEIRDAVYNPNDVIVKGYPKGLMQSYTNVISEEDMNKIIDYLKTLKVE